MRSQTLTRFVALALPLVLLGATPVTVVAQQAPAEDDRGYLTRLIEDNLSGAGRTVRIEGFQGALSSRAQMASMTIADATGVWLRLTDVSLDWQRSALLTGRIEVNSLTAAEIVLERLPATEPALPSPEAVPFALPDLPVSVRLGRIQAERIELGPTVLGRMVEARLDGSANLSGGEGSATLTLERTDDMAGLFKLEGAFANASRNLKLDLSLSEPQGGIAAGLIGLPGQPALDLAITGDAPLDDFEARVRLASEGKDRFAGTVRLAVAEAGGSSFRVDLGGDVTPLFMPAYRGFFGPDVRLFAEGARAADGALDLSALRVDSAALKLNGMAQIGADGMPQRLDLALDMGAVSGPLIRLPVAGDPVQLRAANLRLGFDAGRGDGWTLEGVLNGLQTAALNADRLAVTGNGRIGHSADGRQMVDGQLDFDGGDLALMERALARAVGTMVKGQARFAWTDREPLRFESLQITGEDYRLEAQMALDGSLTAPVLDGRITARMEDLSRLSGLAGRPLAGNGEVGWTGHIEPLSGGFDGVVTVTGRDIRVDQSEADAILKGDSRIRLDAARGAEGLQIRKLDVATRSLNLLGEGWVRSSGPDLRLTMDFSDLSVLGQGRGGRLMAQTTLQGAALDNDLRLNLTGTGNDLRPGIAEADGLLRGEVGLHLQAHLLDGTVALQRLNVTGGSWELDATGSVSESLRDLTARFDFRDLRQAGGRYAGALRGDLTYALRNGREEGAISAAANGLAVGQAEADRLLRGATNLSARASRQDGIIRLEDLRLDNPQLTARADASQTGAERRVDLTARLGDLALLVPGVPGPLTVSGRVDENAGRLTMALDAQGPGGIAARLGGTAALDFSSTALTVTGQADAALANAFLGPVAMRGPLQLDLAMNGRPALASLSGTVRMADGRLTLSDPPFAFSGISANVALGGGRAQVDVQARSDVGGMVAVAGPVNLTAPFIGDLRILLDGLVLRDPQLYQTSASGGLSVSGPLSGGARIAGQIALSQTELRIPSTGLGGAAAIPDLRHVGEPAAVRRTRARAGLLGDGTSAGGGSSSRAYPLDITISAPNQVFIRGRGLDAELGGAFRITGTTANVVPAGGLELVRGRLDLLGKRFAFTEGQMQMEGSMIPTIRLVATTDTVDGTASVMVDGPADAPSIRFSSNPELPEEEVVARLLFGRGLTSLTPIQAAQLASAVATLTGKGGSGVVDRLRKSFGLDDFDISASEGGAAAVRAGKYLSDNIYLDFKIDSEGKTDVSINLDLSKSVTVRGRASADGTTGVGVHFERDY